ncbi:MAG: tyrosine-type recombinase/integrase [Herminiimonas sp.]|nr:tyrosine-type recombinase/integrase [Herminiimonas sp.]
MQRFEIIDLEPLNPSTNGSIAERFYDSTSPRHDRLVSAETDSELARAFLYSNELSENSIRTTKKDLSRFLLWCRFQSKTLSQLRIEDLIAYKGFLKDPQPEETWICTTKWPRGDGRWRPFSGPLSEPSVRQAFQVVKALLEFGTNAGYLQRNAGALVKNIKTARNARVTRYLNEPAIDHVYVALDQRRAATPTAVKAQARDRFLFESYITTGARLAELTAASMGAIYVEGDKRWWFDVMGKGAKPRRLPVAPQMLAALRNYRSAFGLLPHATRDDATPLVLSTRSAALSSVTDEAASNAMKALFSKAADLAEAENDFDSAASLRRASAHWLRHTMLTIHANNDVSLKTLQDTAGHANISTTATYLHKDDRERHDELTESLVRDS